MKFFWKIFIINLCCQIFNYIFAAELVLIGQIPGEYLGLDKNKFFLGSVTIENDLIKKIEKLDNEEDLKLFTKRADKIIHLKDGEEYGAIYPGLIDLHNHPKQNVLPLWNLARGQFANRHEWRDWSKYSHSLGGNMNPWVNNGKIETCAAFRWAELQAMVQGTTLMQGPRFCTENFAIGHVELGDGFRNESENDNDEFVSKELNVQAPTDLFAPEDMTFIYEKVRLRKINKKTFHDALLEELNHSCENIGKFLETLSAPEVLADLEVYNARLKTYQERPTYNKFLSLNIAKERIDIPLLYRKSVMDFLADKNNLSAKCSSDRHEKFDTYFVDYHKSMANKILTLSNPNNSGIIAHLAEGRANDPYNRIEFEIAQTMDLIQPGMNLVHAVGLSKEDLKILKQKQVGVVWSPFSNLLLYGETFNIEDAVKLGINVALGSDWTPTGSKSVLEEVKIAKRFVEKNKLEQIITDEVLYQMMTSAPAKMINKYENDPTDGRHGVGNLAVDAMASIVVVAVTNQNPYTNMVNANENEIMTVLFNGNVIYGNYEILSSFSFSEDQIDWIPQEFDTSAISLSSELENGYDKLEDLFLFEQIAKLKPKKLNIFNKSKGMVISSGIDKDLNKFQEKTDLNLSKASDVQKILQVLLVTQSRNRVENREEYQVESFPSLISLADLNYTKRFNEFIKPEGQDEIEENYVYRLEWRRKEQDSRTIFNENNPHLSPRLSVPHRLSINYNLPYDIELGVSGY